jgi:nucleoside permease NupC
VIYWSSFIWEVFATLATGLAAVAAALVIGLRQMGIAKDQVAIADRQSRILANQAHLEEL